MMHSRLVCSSLLALMSAGLVVAQLPAAPVPVAGKRVAVLETGLSYVPPPGWHTESSSTREMNNEFCQAPFANSFAATFSIGVRGSTKSADRYLQEKAAEIIDNTPELHIRSRALFVTTSGLRGERMLLDVNKPSTPQARRTLLYVLAAPRDQKICVITDALSSDSSKYDPAFDACVKTFTVK